MGHRILHLSDTHVTASGVDEDGVDAAAALDRILYDARHLRGLDLVVVSGDIADDGSTGGCAMVRERVQEFAAKRGIPHVYCTGNHDDRASFAEVLGSGHLTAEGIDVGCLRDENGGERAAVSEVRGLRVITLDSLVPGAVRGLLSTAQLGWVADLLATPAAAGSILILHHPPVHVESSDLMASVGLENGTALASVVAGSDVQAILCGHYHLQLSGYLRGVPVWVTPGVITRIDLTAPAHLERVVRGAGATVVDLGGPFSPTFHVLHARDPDAGAQVYLVDALSGVDVDAERSDDSQPSD